MLSTVKSTVSCRKYRKIPPNIIPVILQIVPEQSILGNYMVAHIIGYNFSLGGVGVLHRDLWKHYEYTSNLLQLLEHFVCYTCN